MMRLERGGTMRNETIYDGYTKDAEFERLMEQVNLIMDVTENFFITGGHPYIVEIGAHFSAMINMTDHGHAQYFNQWFIRKSTGTHPSRNNSDNIHHSPLVVILGI